MLIISNNTEAFKSFLKEGIKIASEGVTTDKLKNLENKALSDDNKISVKERLVIETVKENPDLIKNLSFIDSDPSINLQVLDDSLKEYPRSIDGDYTGSDNPLNAEINDLGKERIADTATEIYIFSSVDSGVKKFTDTIQDPNIKDKASNFILSFKSNSDKKEAMAYMKELLNYRDPAIPKDNLLKLIDKIQYISNNYDYDERIGDPKKLALSALHDISAPSNISQERIGTCSVTSIQIQLAIRNPDKYLDILDTLAQGKNYKNNNTTEITPNWTFSNNDNSNRTISSSILQNALMGFSREENYDSNDKNSRNGLSPERAAKTYSSIFDKNYTASFENSDSLIELLKKQEPSKTNPTQIGLYYNSLSNSNRTHAVNVIGIDDKKVTIINPWGREEKFNLDKLKERISSVIVNESTIIDLKTDK